MPVSLFSRIIDYGMEGNLLRELKLRHVEMERKKEKRPGGEEREMTIFLKSLETFGSNLRLSHYVRK